MNRCRKYREAITLYAFGHRESADSRELVEHLEKCERCRALFEETRSIKNAFVSPVSEGALELTPDFQERLLRQLKAKPKSVLRVAFVWPAAVAAALALLGALSVLFAKWQQPFPNPEIVETIRNEERSSPLSLNTYRLAAAKSLEVLDDLLLEQGLRSFTPSLGAVGGADLEGGANGVQN